MKTKNDITWQEFKAAVISAAMESDLNIRIKKIDYVLERFIQPCYQEMHLTNEFLEMLTKSDELDKFVDAKLARGLAEHLVKSEAFEVYRTPDDEEPGFKPTVRFVGFLRIFRPRK